MVNLLNEEIMAIKNTMSHLKMAIPLEGDSGKREYLKGLYRECQMELEDRLKRCEDFRG